LTGSGKTAKNTLRRAISSAWIERLPPEQKVMGSNPLSPVNEFKDLAILLSPFLLGCYHNKPKQDKTRGKTISVFPLVH
jgi:hypothetical protein